MSHLAAVCRRWKARAPLTRPARQALFSNWGAADHPHPAPTPSATLVVTSGCVPGVARKWVDRRHVAAAPWSRHIPATAAAVAAIPKKTQPRA